MPNKNKLGSKDGDDCMAIISPEKISITHIEPALSFKSSVHNFCISVSIVRLRS